MCRATSFNRSWPKHREVTRSVSEGGRFSRLRIHRLVESSPSLTLRVTWRVAQNGQRTLRTASRCGTLSDYASRVSLPVGATDRNRAAVLADVTPRGRRVVSP